MGVGNGIRLLLFVVLVTSDLYIIGSSAAVYNRKSAKLQYDLEQRTDYTSDATSITTGYVTESTPALTSTEKTTPVPTTTIKPTPTIETTTPLPTSTIKTTPEPTTTETTTPEPTTTIKTTLPPTTTEQPNNDPKPCILRDYHYNSYVCVCNATYCDSLPTVQPLPEGDFVVYSSNRVGLRFLEQHGQFQSNRKEEDAGPALIYINPNKRFQTIHGFGAAFTDASGININSLDEQVKRNLLRSYFSQNGIEYNLASVPFGSTDFSTRPYSYDDGDADPELKKFKLAREDRDIKIPLLKEAKALQNDLLLLGATWTPPPWMKTNGEHGGSGRLIPTYFDAYAEYHNKALEAYEDAGFNFWGITTGNEPNRGFDDTEVPSVGWLAIQLGSWVANNLKPVMENSKYKDVKILTVDDQRAQFPGYPGLMFLGNDVAKDYVDGFAVQWRDNEKTSSEVLTEVYQKYDNKLILTTAARAAPKAPVANGGVQLGVWDHADAYIHNMIEDLSNWSIGWIDNGLALDLNGGPSFVPNTNVEAAIIVNSTAGEFYKQPIFYAQGHISKFVPRGSERISASKVFHDLGVVAFRRPDDGIVVIVYNKGVNEQVVQINDARRGQLLFTATGRSINTVVYW